MKNTEKHHCPSWENNGQGHCPSSYENLQKVPLTLMLFQESYMCQQFQSAKKNQIKYRNKQAYKNKLV